MLRHWHVTDDFSNYGEEWWRTHLTHAHGLDEDSVPGPSILAFHQSLHAGAEWELFMSTGSLDSIEITVDGESFGVDENELADNIQRAVGKVDIEHFHLRSDCDECNALADLPADAESRQKIEAHILVGHLDEVTVH